MDPKPPLGTLRRCGPILRSSVRGPRAGIRRGASIAALAAAGALFAGAASAQVLNYGYGFGFDPSASGGILVVDRQVATDEVESVVTSGTISSSVDAGGQVVTSTQDGNAVSAETDVNLVSPANPIDLFTVSGGGAPDLGGAIAQVQETGDGTTPTTAFARVNGSSITQSTVDAGAGSSVSLDSNVVSADLGLASAVNTIQGDLNPDFQTETVGSVTGATADLTSFLPFNFGAGTAAGLVIGSAQIANTVDSGTAAGAGLDAFSLVDDASAISSSVTGAYGNGLSITANDNVVEARFSSNSVDNLISVGAGGDPTFANSAGILSLQNSSVVGDPAATGTTSALVDGSSVGVTVDGATFSDGSLAVSGNDVQAVAAANTSENDIVFAAGVSVAQPTGFVLQTTSNQVFLDPNALDFGDGLTVEAGLFVVNGQEAMDTDVIATVRGGATTTVSVLDPISGSSVTARDNDALASATGNSTASSIEVAGAGDFDTTVASTSLQTFDLNPLSLGAPPVVTASTTAAGVDVDVAGAGEAVSGTAVVLEDNDVRSEATANLGTTYDDVAGTFVPTVSITASDITAAVTNDPIVFTAAASRTELRSDDPALPDTTFFDALAGVSALSVQGVTGAVVDPVAVTATTDAAVVDLDVSGGAGTVADSSFAVSGSRIASSATLNTERLAVELDAANRMDASSAVALAQEASFATATATTSGAAITADLATSGAAATGNTLVVGDGDPSDGLFGGNAIEATALGQSGTTSLSVAAGGAMVVSGTYDSDPDLDPLTADGADSLGLDVTNALSSVASAEMTVLTDQRLSTAVVDATVSAPVISATVSNGAAAFGAVGDGNTVAVDGNRATATARGATVDNTLAFEAASIDMSGADIQGSQNNTNLATLGALQEIDAASGPIGATVDGAGSITASVSGTGDVIGATVSTDANAVTAFASGATATNVFDASGSALEMTGDTGVATASVGPVDATDRTVELVGATVVGVLQSNAAAVEADVGATTDFTVATSLASTGDITGVTLSADANTVLAQARGTSATTTTTLAFSTIESSAVQAVSQDQSGAVSASLGDVVGAAGGATISVTANGADSNLSGSTLSADRNTLGAELFGATSTSTLSATATGALESGSAAGGTSTLEVGNITASGFDMVSEAEFVSVTRQAVSGAITGMAFDASVAVSTDDIGGGTVTADGNLLTSQATGGRVSSTLALSAGDLGAANADAAAASLMTDQALSGVVDSDISTSDVIVTVADLGTEATTANGAETVSASSNTLSALGTGLSGANTLSATSAGGQGGALAGSASLDLDGSSGALASDVLSTATADQVLISNQFVDAAAAFGITADTVTVQVNQTGAAVDGDTLSVESNTILAQGIGATNANRLTSTSGTTSTASSLVVANQEMDGALDVDVATALVDLSAAGTVNGSTLTLSSNAIRSTAASLTNANTLTVDAGGAITGAAAGTGDLNPDGVNAAAAYDAGILSNQTVGDATADVTSDVTAPTVSLNVTGAIGATAGATLLADANTVSASASGASDTNALTLSSDNALTTVTAGILQQQDSLGAVTAGVTGTAAANVVELTAGSTVASSTLSASDNTLSASASNLTASNTLAADAGTTATATVGSASVTLATNGRGDAGALLLADTAGDRVIAADQSASADADVTASIITDPTVTITATGAVSASAVTLDDNVMSAAATVASTSNTLSNDAGTALATGAGIGSIQDSAADATATLLDGDMAIALGGGVTDGAVSLGSNELTATARGLQATNTLTSAASSIDGNATEAFSTVWGATANEATLTNAGMAQLSSVQQQSGAVSATVGQGADGENSALSVAVTGAVSGSTIGVDANATTAQAVGASGANTLSQTASGAIAVGSGANLGSLQQLGAGATGATITGLRAETTVSTTVDGSTLSVDGNAALAAATGGTASNALSISAGTSVTGGGDLSLVQNVFDAAASTLTQTSAGDAVLGSAQISASAVTATAQPGTDGLVASLDVNGAVGGATASTLTVDGNSFRALGTNLTASNTLSVEADASITTYGAGLASLQDVNAATTGTVSGAQATLDAAAAFTGTGSVSENLLVAAGAGGSATNSLTLSAADLADGGAATAVSADLTGPTSSAPVTASGADLASGVSSIQTRAGAVTAQLTDGTLAGAGGNLTVSATLTGAVTGSVAVDGNTLLAQARGLSATNGLTTTLDNSLTDASLNVSSLQEAESGTVTAAINAGSTVTTDDARIGITAGAAATGTLSLDGNVAQAAALANLATNTLAVTAAGGVSVGTETAATIGADQDLDAATIGLSVMNGQLATAGSVATIANFDIETAIAATGGSLTGTATVDGNRVIGDARNNFATNALSVDAANGLAASAALLNSQQSDAGADVSTTINGGVNDLGRIGLTASNTVAGTASVSGNMVQGNAVANQAFNSMALDAATLATAGGGSATAGSAGTADFVALNSQTSAADATSLVTGYTIGATLTPTGTFAGTARVDDNMILASAGGNLATNVFTLDAAGNSRGDFISASLQSNTGAVSARIASMTVGLSAGVGATSATGAFSLDGNRIGATAQGNVSITTLGMTGSSFSNR